VLLYVVNKISIKYDVKFDLAIRILDSVVHNAMERGCPIQKTKLQNSQ